VQDTTKLLGYDNANQHRFPETISVSPWFERPIAVFSSFPCDGVAPRRMKNALRWRILPCALVGRSVSLWSCEAA
jgi:hypothetical protein